MAYSIGLAGKGGTGKTTVINAIIKIYKELGAKIQLFKECLGGLPCRFQHYDYQHSCVITGPTQLRGAQIDIPALRAGFSYLVVCWCTALPE